MATLTLAQLKERLLRPLLAELNNGCRNIVIKGGLGRMLAEPIANPFPKVRELLQGYDNWTPEERQKALSRALDLLRDDGDRTQSDRSSSSYSASSIASSSFENQLENQKVTPLMPLAQLDTGRGGTAKLISLGLYTLRDLWHAYPHRHEDRRALPNLTQIEDDQRITVSGTVVSRYTRAPKPNMNLLEAVIENKNGHRVTATWFNQPWLEKRIHTGSQIIVTGKAKRFGKIIKLSVQYFENISQLEGNLNTGRIVGVYDAKEGISQEFIRKVVHKALQYHIYDYFPSRWREKYSLCPLGEALNNIHFPKDERDLLKAKERLTFDEYLFLELRLLLQGEDAVLQGKRFAAKEEDLISFEKTLPFSFTNAQRRVLGEIVSDMRSEQQMARLVQGDVGSGKTAVAACAMYLCVCDHAQAALMAPTEILARQHYTNLQKYLEPLGVSVGLLIGAMTPKMKLDMQRRIAAGDVQVVVGTQALIQEGVTFAHLGLAVIDEEHRFGVQQRRKLIASRPDVLVMSATPIPRSLALTAYGDLELSVIDELPPGRTPIETHLLGEIHRSRAYRFVMSQIREGRQAYAVTALIEENETLELLAATQLAEDLRSMLPEARIDLLHGKMSAAEKDEIMERFRAQEFDILVSTTVIEVGVDVPNATVMVIENAERFGLSQLHQLRGRVGRGSLQSYCLLVAGQASAKTMKRLKIIEESTDGFVIAEADLRLRGPGEIRGTRQSGIPDLRLADLLNDEEVIVRARELAKYILANDPKLEHPALNYLRTELQSRSQSVAYREII